MRSKEGGRTFADQARRDQIVACAIEVIAELGYPQASVRKIAQRVGVAMSVVLYHFANKDELIEATAAHLYRAFAADIAPAVAAEPTAAGKLRAYLRANAAFVQAHRTHQQAAAEIWSNYRPANGTPFAELGLTQENRAALAELDLTPILQRGQETGEFRAFSASSMAIAVRWALNAAVPELLRDPEFDVLAYGEELVTLFDLATRRQP
jgi:AcrR family transcriptional regulator